MKILDTSLILNKIVSNKICSKKEINYIEKEILSLFTLYENDNEERDGIKILRFNNKYFARIRINQPTLIEGFSSFTKCLSSNFWTQLNVKVFNLENDNKNINKSSSKIKKIINNQTKKIKTSGSDIAKSGFDYEIIVLNKFNNWKKDEESKIWLTSLLAEKTKTLFNVSAIKAKGNHKSDIFVTLTNNNKDSTNYGISIKKTVVGFSQLDKRWVDSYKKLWDIPEDVVELLKFYTGENNPNNYLNCPKSLRDKRRLYLTEMTNNDKSKILDFFSFNKLKILIDIFQGKGEFLANWILVYDEVSKFSIIRPMSEVIEFFLQGDIKISSEGCLNFAGLTVQRKGGDLGKDSANMLQFKFNPKILLKVAKNIY